MFGGGQPHRLTPKLPASGFKTYNISMPAETHHRPATCAESECPAHLRGWVTILPAGSDLISVLKTSGRRYREHRDHLPLAVVRQMPGHEDDTADLSIGEGLVAFYFEPGQSCFQESTHTVPLERPALYVVRDGDWRGNPRRTPPRVHTRPEDWVEDFAGHQDRLKTTIEGG